MLLVILLVASSSAFVAKNTTKFWETKLNTTLHFQSFSGKFALMQAIKRSIGIILLAKPECSTACSELLATTFMDSPQRTCP